MQMDALIVESLGHEKPALIAEKPAVCKSKV